jgi:putative transposase
MPAALSLDRRLTLGAADRRVVSGIIHVIRNGLRWRDAPEVYGPHKTLYNRFVRWSRMGVFDRILSGLASRIATADPTLRRSKHGKPNPALTPLKPTIIPCNFPLVISA